MGVVGPLRRYPAAVAPLRRYPAAGYLRSGCYGLADDNGPLRRYPACVLWPATCAMLKPFVGENVFHCVLWLANYDTPPGMAPTVCMGDEGT